VRSWPRRQCDDGTREPGQRADGGCRGAAAGPGPRAGPDGDPAKPVRVTVDLDPATYTELNRWAGSAAIAVNPDFPRLPLAKAIRAMIHATAASEAVTSAVIEQLRQGRDLRQ
jgi:hypothetical protein